MSDRIILQNLTVLAICPSARWSTLQRRALFDCTYIRDIGGNPVILCLENSQVAQQASQEDIPTIFIKKHKLTGYKDISFVFEFKNLLKEKRFDIIHCYDLNIMWISAFLMKSNQSIPLFLTFNQNIKKVYHSMFSEWLLRRVDCIFTLSLETQDFVKESFYIANHKVKNIGSGLDVLQSAKEKKKPKVLGCIVDNLKELKRLKAVIRMFRYTKSQTDQEEIKDLSLMLFLGPIVYGSKQAKKLLTEMDHEFYEGDIFLYELVERQKDLKKIDILISLAFDEPLNDYEVTNLIQDTPVLFPRTAMRQSLVLKYDQIGETYFEGDIRELRSKLLKIIAKYPKYLKSLASFTKDIYELHGIESYGNLLASVYAQHFEKRARFVKAKK
ncbi:MAG: hypothetical protein CME62_16065 [Halobacteriovoraceae bacterium]|nr:hypothetical protein [Halobacteriovoraceae bacterium]|tara:strand:- start:3130 stop:4284 length:1155 start_codon:yes stop_codon:yes gene_type:complete